MKQYNPGLLILLLLVTGPQQGCIFLSTSKEQTMNIIGQWRKRSQNECGEKYPEQIEFKPNGLYQAQASNQARFHPVWDVGTFALQDSIVTLSTANDAVVRYAVEINGTTIAFTDPEGCSVQYEKM